MDASGWTTVFAAIAAATAILGVVMQTVRQNRRHNWESDQDGLRREWERDQVLERQAWEETQKLLVRWDADKRGLYVRFLNGFNQITRIQDDLADISRHLGEDLVNRMYMIEQILQDNHDADLLKAQKEGGEKAFWEEIYQREEASLKRERSELSEMKNGLISVLEETSTELKLVAPAAMVALADEMTALSRQYFSRRAPDTIAIRRAELCSDFEQGARDDLRIPQVDARSAP